MKINPNNQNYFVKNSQNVENTSSSKSVEAGTLGSVTGNSANISNQSNVTLSSSLAFTNLTRAQQAVLIRELLNLPKDLKDLLALLTYNEITQEAVIKLLQENEKGVPVKDLQLLLSNNSKDVVGKLLKLLQTSTGNIQNTEQLNKLINLLNQVVPSQNSLPQEVLAKTILLYLPWLPLVQQQDISFRFEEGGEEQKSKSENVALVMYITTINLGKFKVTIILNSDGTLNIEIESEEVDKYQSYLEQILKSINQEMVSNKIAGKTNIYSQKSKVETEPDKREISIYPVSDISPKIMITAYTVARIIFEFDEKISRDNGRKQLLD